jgi:phosphoribosylamine--glycine ligase
MNIGLIGSGGREHALCQKIHESKLIKKIICFPGNAGTAKIAKNIKADILNFREIHQLVQFHKIDLVIVGPEEPLVRGLVDYLREKKIKVFGPDKFASRLEGSKAFMKKVCKSNNIPTADYKICKNKKDVLNFLKKSKLPLVVKADGLAAGKGVTICSSKKKVLKISEEIFKGKFKSSKKIVLEEFLEGEEASYFVIADKKTFKFFGTAQDHKRVKENDKGPNTGGMGAYSPAKIIDKKLEKKIINKIIKPTFFALKKKKIYYTGFLYVGLMIQDNEPYLIEFNVRMGDPECQVILPRLKTDLIKIIKNVVNNKLKQTSINWHKKKSMTVVLCSKGYPGKYKKNKTIKNLDRIKLNKNDFIYHAGTKLENDQLKSNGGRVLNITSVGTDFLNIRKKIIKIIKNINWKGGFFRRDIGWKIINK